LVWALDRWIFFLSSFSLLLLLSGRLRDLLAVETDIEIRIQMVVTLGSFCGGESFLGKEFFPFLISRRLNPSNTTAKEMMRVRGL